ncbi:MAG TPA: type IV secretion system protein [Streptosporangiaceae bacterium]|nr:type IV secretion system protein [Streptosporangiaceae bacterium]
MPRKTAVALVLLVVLFSMLRGAAQDGHEAGPGASGKPVAARTLSATRPAGGPCSVPGIGDIGGLLGFCSLGQSGLIGSVNSLCQPGVPQPESATAGVDALIRPPAAPGKPVATPYNQYGMSGQFWAPFDLQCSDMTSLIGNDVAGMLFDFAKALDRVTITVYQSAAGEGILSWLQGVTDHLISGLGNAIYFPYVALVVILAAIWLAWQGLIRKRGTRTIEGTIWMVLACAAAIWLIGRPADFTGLGKGVSDGISTTLNTAFANLPSPGQASCLPVKAHDPQISRASFSYTSSRTVVDQNANELWTVLVCKPWLDGEFGTTAFAAAGKATPVSAYARQLLWAQAIAANEHPTTALVNAKQAAYQGIATTIQRQDPSVYPLFQGKEWTTRLEIGFAALLAALVAGVLVLLISATLILLKLSFLLLLIAGPFFLLIGTHPGFGRVVAVRWFELLVGVLLKQAAVALALSVLLYCYALIMGTTDAVLPWALKILMITLVTVAVFIYRKPFQHLFAAVGYGAIGSTERAEADLGRAAATARANTRDAATLAVPGFAAYRAARWARRNPAQAAGLALSTVTAASTAGVAAGAAGMDVSGSGEYAGAGQVPAGVASGAGGSGDPASNGGQPGAAGRARAWGASAGTASASEAPPLRLPPSQGTPASWANGGPSAGQPPAPRTRGVAGPAGGSGNGSSAPPLPPMVRSSGGAASPASQAARGSSGPSVPSRSSGAGSPPPSAKPSVPARSAGPAVPPSWSTRGTPPRRSATPPPPRSGWGGRGSPASGGAPRQDAASPARRPAADRTPPSQSRPAGGVRPERPARPWRLSGQGRPARQQGTGRSGPPASRAGGGPAGGPADSAGQSGSNGNFSAAPYGLKPGGTDDPPAGPFWSRPIWRRK